MWLLGVAILVALIVEPDLGLRALWCAVIPAMPALLVVAPGVWRNVCPLAVTSLLPRRVGRSSRRRLSPQTLGVLNLAGLALLLVVVPFRHLLLDTNGLAVSALLGVVSVVAAVMGARFEWKSGWCSGLCPVHPVEQLYGERPAVTVVNAHCTSCERCVALCPDSQPSMTPAVGIASKARRWTGLLMTGGFVGFEWGWFHVPDYAGAEGWAHLGAIYGLPMAGGVLTLVAFVGLRSVAPGHRALLVRLFAVAAVGLYYWYRVPMLLGFGAFHGLGMSARNGVLVDLRGALPAWFPAASHAFTTVFFAWFLVARHGRARSWNARPPYAQSQRHGARVVTLLVAGGA